ncbi:MAG: NTP transferase domain-containing protein [Gammaproteobacteria bacterium]|nr:NTP transferase domain-containing protein [Gammaproteobacteria bacterium]
MITTAIVLAGGLGTRLRGVVPDLPKPMAPINGRPFLEYQLDYWIGQGIRRFILSVGYRCDGIMAHFGSQYRGVTIDYAIEKAPLGTGGGMLLAVERLADSAPFLLLNGDTFFEVELTALQAFHCSHSSAWTFCLFRANEAGRYMGMEVAADGRIRALRSGQGEIGALANGGVYLIEPELLSLLRSTFSSGAKVSLEDDVLPALQALGGSFYGFECTGRFIDIGIPADYFRATAILN